MSKWEPQSPEAFAAMCVAKERAGFTVVHDGPGIILLDLDNAAALCQYHKNKRLLAEQFGVIEMADGFWPSKSYTGTNPHYHVQLSCLAKFSADERSIFALILGSDPQREVCCMVERNAGLYDTNVLFRPKGA